MSHINGGIGRWPMSPNNGGTGGLADATVVLVPIGGHADATPAAVDARLGARTVADARMDLSPDPDSFGCSYGRSREQASRASALAGRRVAWPPA